MVPEPDTGFYIIIHYTNISCRKTAGCVLLTVNNIVRYNAQGITKITTSCCYQSISDNFRCRLKVLQKWLQERHTGGVHSQNLIVLEQAKPWDRSNVSHNSQLKVLNTPWFAPCLDHHQKFLVVLNFPLPWVYTCHTWHNIHARSKTRLDDLSCELLGN